MTTAERQAMETFVKVCAELEILQADTGYGKSVRYLRRCLGEIARLLDVLEAQQDIIDEYATHETRCILNDYQAGEPTPDGGYRCLYRGIWYESRPVDRCPKCDCGLAAKLDTLARWPKATTDG